MGTQGFTLKEVLVTVLIISILVALLLPVLFKGIRIAKIARQKAQLRDEAVGWYCDNMYQPPRLSPDAPHPLLRLERNFWAPKLDPMMEPR